MCTMTLITYFVNTIDHNSYFFEGSELNNLINEQMKQKHSIYEI